MKPQISKLITETKDSIFKTGKSNSTLLTRPFQFLSKKDKDFEWYARNLDWLEFYGYNQLRTRSMKMLKNYKIVAGVIDKEDYVVSEDNENSLFVTFLSEDNSHDTSVTDLKFYPLVPRIINTLTTEFSKRKTEVLYRAVDIYSVNEVLELRNEELKKLVYNQLSVAIYKEMVKFGFIDESQVTPEVKDAIAQDYISKIPQINEYFNKNFVLKVEELAAKLHEIDSNRLKMDELELSAFVDFLTTSSAFFHFRMEENNYFIENWNPMFTFYRKKPSSYFISDGDFVGKIELMTIQEIVDRYGRYIDPDDLTKLETYYGNVNANQALTGYENDGSYFVNVKGYDNSAYSGSLDYRRTLYWFDNIGNLQDIISNLFISSEDARGNLLGSYLRVTTAYWKTYKKVGKLTKIDINGNKIETIVSEDYVITDKSVYNTSLKNEQNEETLVFGEHIEWEWITEVVGGIKISRNGISYFTPFSDDKEKNDTGLPIYLGIGRKEPGPVRYQFKDGVDNIYGCRLPVEGIVYTEKNVKVSSLVDLTKPFQVAYNLVNNQIMDILLDELGSVILIDQNVLPKHSLAEDWASDPYMRAYLAMKQFKMLPVDTSAANLENPINFNHFQALNLEQSARISSRIQLAEFFKLQCFEAIGFTMERLMGTSGQYQSAKSAELSIVQSYNVTEKWFMLFTDQLMPRVHEMRTNLAFYYLTFSENPPKYLINILNTGERNILKIDDEALALRDLCIFITNKINYRNILDQIKQVVVNNNTLGLSISDLAEILGSNSYNKLLQMLKVMEEKRQKQAELEAEQKREELKQLSLLNMEEKKLAYEYNKAIEELKARYRLLETQLKSYGYSVGDINQNKIPDVYDLQQMFRQTEEYKKELENTKSNYEQVMQEYEQKIKKLTEEIEQYKKNT